jgi:hypothetical protein
VLPFDHGQNLPWPGGWSSAGGTGAFSLASALTCGTWAHRVRASGQRGQSGQEDIVNRLRRDGEKGGWFRTSDFDSDNG